MRPIESLNTEEKSKLVQEILDKKDGHNPIEWRDLVQQYDLSCNPETLRKAGVGIKLAKDAGMSFDAAPKDLSGLEGYAERQKLYDLRNEIKKDLREQSRSEMIREEIRKAIAELEPIDIKLKETPAENVRGDLVVGVGDFHFGADYEVTGLYGEVINKYNSDVFQERMQKLAEEVGAIAERHNPKQITVLIAGDMLDGLLRNSQISRLQYGVVESAMRLSEYLSQWLWKLVSATNRPVRVYAVRGNHGEIRPLGSKAGQFPEENMERIVMHYLHERFAVSEYVLVVDDDAPLTRMVEVCGYNILLLHGQGDDIEKIARDHQLLYNKPIDMFVCGHLHKSQTFNAGISKHGDVLIERVPSLCGMDPYAQSKGYGSKAGATVILFEEGYGRRCVYPIVLS